MIFLICLPLKHLYWLSWQKFLAIATCEARWLMIAIGWGTQCYTSLQQLGGQHNEHTHTQSSSPKHTKSFTDVKLWIQHTQDCLGKSVKWSRYSVIENANLGKFHTFSHVETYQEEKDACPAVLAHELSRPPSLASMGWPLGLSAGAKHDFRKVTLGVSPTGRQNP